MRACVMTSDGVAVNIVQLPDDYDPKARGAWTPPEGCQIRKVADDSPVAAGWVFRQGQWLGPEYVEPVDLLAQVAAEVAALRAPSRTPGSPCLT